MSPVLTEQNDDLADVFGDLYEDEEVLESEGD